MLIFQRNISLQYYPQILYENNYPMLFYTFLSQYINKKIGLVIRDGSTVEGTLLSVDMYLNVKLKDALFQNQSNFIENSTPLIYIRGNFIESYEIENVEEDKALDATRHRFLIMNKFEEN